MRVAILSDIHGNSIALDAVLADIQSNGGVDAFWLLGDLAAIGHDPIGTLERLAQLPNAHFVRGNTDRYLVTSERPPPTIEQAEANPKLWKTLVEVADSFGWTQGMVTAAGWLEWLEALPLEYRTELPDGSRVLCVHASPGNDEHPAFYPSMSPAEAGSLVDGCQAELVLVGHTHQPLDVYAKGVHLVNAGSVSNPFPPDLRASYVLLEADKQGNRVYHRQVEYDREAVIAAVRRSRHPSGQFIVQFMRGKVLPSIS